jgi:hypothetical protein
MNPLSRIGIFTAFILSAFHAFTQKPVPEQKPNIILFLVDNKIPVK